MSKHGTMDHLKHLGLCWCLAFASFAALADFGVSDSATLNQIAIDVAHAANASQGADRSLVAICSDTGALTHDVYQAQQNLEVMKGYLYRLSYSGLRSITNALWGIFDKLETDSQHHLSGPDTNTSYDSIYVHDVRNDDIYTRLGDLQDSINNLTNYLCYSPSFVTSINTNLPFLLMSLNFYQGDSQLKNAIRGIYQSLYGRSPSSDELNSLLSLTKNNNITRNFGALLLRDLPYSSLSSLDMQKYQYLMQYYGWQGSNPQTVLRNAGDIRYAYYGTRVLTDTSIGISNIVAQINQSFSNIFNSVQGEYSGARQLEDSLQRPVVYDEDGNVRNDSGIVSAVVNLADDFCETIPSANTNDIAEVSTNEIVNIADADYQNSLNRITIDAITENDTVLGLQQAVDSINQQFVSFIPQVSDTDSLVLDFGTVSLFGVSKSLVFTFQRLPALYWTIQRFLFAFLKALMVFLAIHAIYHHIAVESPL